MEWGCIGFLLGAIVSLVFCGIGVCFGRNDSKEPDDDSDVRLYIPDRDRGRRCVERYSTQEMIFVLDNVKRLTHGEEREIMDAIIKLVEGSNV